MKSERKVAVITGASRGLLGSFSIRERTDLALSNLGALAHTYLQRSDQIIYQIGGVVMSPETKELLKTTWAKVIPISDVAAGLFYERLFTLDPSLQRLFKNADMKEQRRKLVQALHAVINSVDDLPSLIPTLEILGRNHVRYGVEDRHYETVGSALLWTLEQGLKEAWTPAAKSAWVVAYSTVSGVMRNAAAASRENATTTAQAI